MIIIFLLCTNSGYAGFFIKSEAHHPVLLHHQQHMVKTALSNFHEHLATGYTHHYPGNFWHVFIGILSYLLAIASLCMVVIGVASLFVTSAVPGSLAIALLLAGGLLAGVIAIELGYNADNGAGLVGRRFAGIAVFVVLLPFILLWFLFAFLVHIIFHPYPRNKKNKQGFVNKLLDKAFSPADL